MAAFNIGLAISRMPRAGATAEARPDCGRTSARAAVARAAGALRKRRSSVMHAAACPSRSSIACAATTTSCCVNERAHAPRLRVRGNRRERAIIEAPTSTYRRRDLDLVASRARVKRAASLSFPLPSSATVRGLPCGHRTAGLDGPRHAAGPNPSNLYREQTAESACRPSPTTCHALRSPHIQSNDVYVIDPATLIIDSTGSVSTASHRAVVDLRPVGREHRGEHEKRRVMPIDPRTGKVGKAITGRGSYNLYFSPDGKCRDRRRRGVQALDFRDPQTMALQSSLELPHARASPRDFSIDGRYAIFPAIVRQSLVKIDMVGASRSPTQALARRHPQDIRISPTAAVLRGGHDGRRRLRRRRRVRSRRSTSSIPARERTACTRAATRKKLCSREPRVKQDPRDRPRAGRCLGR